MRYLQLWNSMPADAAAAAVLPCCGSRGWAAALVARRPLGTLPELLAASDSAWWSLGPADWDEAFATHPRLGKPAGVATHTAPTGTAQSLQWSSGEQSALQASADSSLQEQIAANNLAYEQRFGRVFLLRAAGRSAAEVLAIQQVRLRNTAEAELREAAEQQREITHGRLQRWLEQHEAAA